VHTIVFMAEICVVSHSQFQRAVTLHICATPSHWCWSSNSNNQLNRHLTTS